MRQQGDKTAIVTGSSRGIGAAVALRLARDGFNVLIDYAGDAKEADRIVTQIRQAAGTALAVKADVSDPAAMRSLFDAAEAAFGGVDVLVNNAGIMRLSPFADASDALFDRHVSVNLKGVFNGLR
jgi:3-oxoacyl-[acyl-carrier protein] reductase